MIGFDGITYCVIRLRAFSLSADSTHHVSETVSARNVSIALRWYSMYLPLVSNRKLPDTVRRAQMTLFLRSSIIRNGRTVSKRQLCVRNHSDPVGAVMMLLY